MDALIGSLAHKHANLEFLEVTFGQDYQEWLKQREMQTPGIARVLKKGGFAISPRLINLSFNRAINPQQASGKLLSRNCDALSGQQRAARANDLPAKCAAREGRVASIRSQLHNPDAWGGWARPVPLWSVVRNRCVRQHCRGRHFHGVLCSSPTGKEFGSPVLFTNEHLLFLSSLPAFREKGELGPGRRMRRERSALKSVVLLMPSMWQQPTGGSSECPR
ncbi:hypothetical protein AAY473_038300 [Plecturocebus cupreus]